MKPILKWPDTEENFEGDYDEDDRDSYTDGIRNTQDYEIKFKAKGLSDEEVTWISRYLFEAIAKELKIPYEKLDDLEIEED